MSENETQLDYENSCIKPQAACPKCGADTAHIWYQDSETNDWTTTRMAWCELCKTVWCEVLEIHDPDPANDWSWERDE